MRYHRGDIFENVDYVQVFFLVSSSSYDISYLRVISLPPPRFLVYLIPKMCDSFKVLSMFMKSDFIDNAHLLHV